jgi:hypothetical protein
LEGENLLLSRAGESLFCHVPDVRDGEEEDTIAADDETLFGWSERLKWVGIRGHR